MPRINQNLIQNSLFRYVFVGGMAYIIDIGVLILCYEVLHTPRGVAAGVSFWAGLLFSFGMQKFVAFQDFQKEVKAISKQVFWYAGLVAFNYFLTIVVVSYFPGKDIILSRTLAVAITTLWNYLIFKNIIFKSSQDRSKENKSKQDKAEGD